MRTRLLTTLLAILLFGPNAASPQLSFRTTSVAFASQTCIPFGCYAIPRYQQVYGASIFASASGPIWTNRVTFFNDVDDMANGLPVHQANYQVSLTTTDRLVNDLAISFASNTNGTVQLCATEY
jgi:hypothetical protein